MKLEKVGMRTIKTGLALSLCSIAGTFLVENIMYAGVGCLVSIQDTVKGSFKLGLNRVKGTMIGGIIGYLSIIMYPNNHIACGIGSMITIYICNLYKINSGIIVSIVTFLSIYTEFITQSPEIYSIKRVWDTSMGVVIGIVVNYLVARPNYAHLVKQKINQINEIMEEYIDVKIVKNKEYDLSKMLSEIRKLDSICQKLQDEIKYSNEDINVDIIIKQQAKIKSVYNHMKSIESIEKEHSINSLNIELLKEIYDIQSINREIDDNESPVFNYHLSKIVSQSQRIYKLGNEI